MPKPERHNDIITIALKNYQSAVNESAEMMKKPKELRSARLSLFNSPKKLQSFYYHKYHFYTLGLTSTLHY